MQAIRLDAPEKFSLTELAKPSQVGGGEALVRVHRVGVCGTDISGYLGKMPFFAYPVIPGHELGVEVLEVGNEVSSVREGDRCSVEPYLNDPGSFASQRGRPNCCEELKVLGVHTDGGLREQLVVPARKLHSSQKLSFDQLALVETLAIGCHAVERARLEAEEHVLIIGAGPIGLSVIEFAKVAGARITVLDLNEKRLQFCAKTLNVPNIVQGSQTEDVLDRFKELTDGNLFTAVFDATGSNRSMSNAVEYVGHTGRLIFVGISTQPLTYYHPLLHRREMTLLTSRNALPGDFSKIIDLIERGVVDTSPWITHRSRFESLIEDFPAFTKPQTGVVKAMVELS